jgi:hypothetical protein
MNLAWLMTAAKTIFTTETQRHGEREPKSKSEGTEVAEDTEA